MFDIILYLEEIEFDEIFFENHSMDNEWIWLYKTELKSVVE